MVPFDVIIVGGGPSGLCLGNALLEKSLNIIVLEQGQIGNSWANMPDHLGTITYWKSNFLRKADDKYYKLNSITSASEMVSYLESVAKKLNIKENSKVIKIENTNDVYSVVSSTGTYFSKKVVLATGYYFNPYTPDFTKDHCEIEEIHFSDYKNSESLKKYNDILVVGKGLSAGQIIEEIAKDKSKNVSISARGKLKFGAHPLIQNFTLRFLSVFDYLYMKFSGRPISVPMGYGAKKYINNNQYSNIDRIEGRSVYFEDGVCRDFDLIIYCTGFRPVANKFFNEEKIEGFQSTENKGVFYLGLESQRNFKSRFLRGIREDSLILADLISSQTRLD